MIPAQEALERLRKGNREFAAGTQNAETLLNPSRRASLANEQRPFAIILGCSDSRVPAEIVFNQGLGDLFVIRVAGNIVAPSQIGSVEFAASQFETRLVVVLGHSQCGAVHATLEDFRDPTATRSRNLMSIVSRIRPAVEDLMINSEGKDEAELASLAVRANVMASVEQLRHGSEILEDLISNGGLQVVGAEYSLETGLVNFLGNT